MFRELFLDEGHPVLMDAGQDGKSTIRELLDAAGETPTLPEYKPGSPVCLSWALKGKCNNQCPRKGTHKRGFFLG